MKCPYCPKSELRSSRANYTIADSRRLGNALPAEELLVDVTIDSICPDCNREVTTRETRNYHLVPDVPAPAYRPPVVPPEDFFLRSKSHS